MKHVIKSELIEGNTLKVQHLTEMDRTIIHIKDKSSGKRQVADIALTKNEVTDLIDCLKLIHSQM